MGIFARIIVILCMVGCASTETLNEYGYVWIKSNRPPLPYRVEVVKSWPVPVKNSQCGQYFNLYACAVYIKDFEKDEFVECVIYTKFKDMPRQLLQHELKHCEGWDHQ